MCRLGPAAYEVADSGALFASGGFAGRVRLSGVTMPGMLTTGPIPSGMLGPCVVWSRVVLSGMLRPGLALSGGRIPGVLLSEVLMSPHPTPGRDVGRRSRVVGYDADDTVNGDVPDPLGQLDHR